MMMGGEAGNWCCAGRDRVRRPLDVCRLYVDVIIDNHFYPVYPPSAPALVK